MPSQSRSNLLIILVLVSFSAFKLEAQETFKYKADLGKIEQNGFYQIALDPLLLARSNRDLSDIRIMDKKRVFIPYVSQSSLPDTKVKFTAFRILKNARESDTTSSLIIENAENRAINRIWLNLKNSNVSRKADLSGSNDLKNWYAIDEGIVLQNAFYSVKDNYYQSLSFPPANYQYLQVLIYNQRKSPLNILQAGIFNNYSKGPLYQPLPAAHLIQKRDSSNQNTYVRLRYKENYRLDKLAFDIVSPRYFKRTVELFELKGKERIWISKAEFFSGTRNELKISAKGHDFEVVIHNGDNIPLKIEKIIAWQLGTSILVYLEKGMDYSLLTGNISATMPDYDLHFFSDSALSRLSDISYSNFGLNPLYKQSDVKNNKEWSILLWPAIASALLLLFWLARNMLKELNARGKV